MNKSTAVRLNVAATIATLTLALTLAFAADAQPPTMNSICTMIPCIRDAHGSIVYVPSNPQMRQIRGVWYDALINVSNADEDGIIPQGTYFYPTIDCSGGTAYMSDNGVIPIIQYDRDVFFATKGGPTEFHWLAYSYPAKVNRGGECYAYGPNCRDQNGNSTPCKGTGGIATKIETVTFSPPFKMQ